MSFFAQTKQDLLEESGPVIPPTTTNTPGFVETPTEVSPLVEPSAEKELVVEPSITTTESVEPERKDKLPIATEFNLDARNNGLHSFFFRPFRGSFRGGNLRHR